jgi:hypothetical protein
MRWLYPSLALGLGFHVLFAAAVLFSPQWFAIGLFSIACGVVDLMRLLGVTVAYAFECLAWLAVWLVLSAANPFRPKQGD